MNSLINKFKEKDSEPRFVENNFLTALTGQSTHQGLVNKSGLRRILFDKSCLGHILFHKKSGLRHILLIKNPLRKQTFGDVFHCKFLILSTNSLIVKMV